MAGEIPSTAELIEEEEPPTSSAKGQRHPGHIPLSAQLEEEEPRPKPATAPTGVHLAHPMSAEELNSYPNAWEAFKAHSRALEPEDQRVSYRLNHDTGSEKIVGKYFVPGDPANERLLRGLSAADRAKLPWLEEAIRRKTPFSYQYGSAGQARPGSRPTAAQRRGEYGAASASERAKGLKATQESLITMIPEQMYATKPSKKKNEPHNILLEGFGNDEVMNNAEHVFDAAQASDTKIPYQGDRDEQRQQYTGNLQHYLNNQLHGYRGDGSGPVLDESGEPNRIWQEEQQRPGQVYVPHHLDKAQAEFVHATLNIRPGKKVGTVAPSFAEHGRWLRRINEAYAGHTAQTNRLLDELGRKMPNVPEYKLNEEANEWQRTGKMLPWREGTLEPTWRAHRLELIRPGPTEVQSIREGEPGAVHVAPHYRHDISQYEPQRSAPSEGEVGSYETGIEPGAEQPAQPQRQTFEAVSPSIRTDGTFNTSRIALRKPQHAQFVDFNNRLEEANAQANGYQQPATSQDTIGDWNDGAENTVMSQSQNQEYKHRRLVSALKGAHGAQKQTLLFRHDEEGPHSKYELHFNTDKPEQARLLMTQHGLTMRTLEPAEKGKPVRAHIVDLSEDNNLLPGIEKLIKEGHVQQAWHDYGHGELLGDENGEDREEAKKAYSRIFGEAREEWNQAQKPSKGKHGGIRSDQAPWWEPFEQEALANFEKLRASKEYQAQELKKDLASADIDRKNVSPERQREIDEGKKKAQAWVDANPGSNRLSAHHFLDKHEEFPDWVKKNEHVAEFFNARNDKLDYNKTKDRKVAADALTHDIMHALSRDSSALGWYGETVNKAMNKFGEVAPKILSDPEHNLAFRLSLAITSQGQNVFNNAESAYKVYRYWEQHGHFPTENAKEIFGGGIKSPAMLFNFAKVNRLWHGDKDSPGLGAQGLEDFFAQNMSHSQLKKEHNISVGSTLMDAMLPASAALGPKVGVFYRNLSGDEDPLTIDLWFSRNLNRLAGDMFGFSESAMRKDRGKDKAHLTTLRELLDSGQLTSVGEKQQGTMRKEIDRLLAAKNLDRDRAIKLAPTILNWAERQHKEYAQTITDEEGNKRSYHPSLATGENLNAKAFDENIKALQDDPRNGTERANWIKVLDEVRDNMKEAGIHITNADRQALLWFMEQKLFQGVTGAKETSFDYLDAAHSLARRVKQGLL